MFRIFTWVFTFRLVLRKHYDNLIFIYLACEIKNSLKICGNFQKFPVLINFWKICKHRGSVYKPDHKCVFINFRKFGEKNLKFPKPFAIITRDISNYNFLMILVKTYVSFQTFVVPLRMGVARIFSRGNTFRKCWKYFQGKLRKMHYFSILTKDLTNLALEFCAFGRKMQIVVKFCESFEIFWWKFYRKLEFLTIFWKICY